MFWRVPRLGLDCLRARFRRHAYARHTHETYALAAILEGCETFFHRGRQHYATPGAIALVGPDELHDGARTTSAASSTARLPVGGPHARGRGGDLGEARPASAALSQPVVDDPELAALLAEAHGTLERPHEPLLARDARVVSLLSLLIVRYTDAGAELPGKAGARASRERPRLSRRALRRGRRPSRSRPYRRPVADAPHPRLPPRDRAYASRLSPRPTLPRREPRARARRGTGLGF